MTHVIESSLSGQVEKYHLRTISACSCFHPSTAGFSFFSSLVFNLLTPELWGCWVVVIVQVWKGALMHLLAMNLLDCTHSLRKVLSSVCMYLTHTFFPFGVCNKLERKTIINESLRYTLLS